MSGRVVLKKGDTVPGLTGANVALYVDEPAVTSTGKVGFRGQVSVGNESFVFIDNAAVHRDSDIPSLTISGAEDQVGVSDGGKFSYIPYGTVDYFVTHQGEIFREGDSAPSYTSQTLGDMYYTRMSADGTAYVFSQVRSGTSTVGETIYKVNEAGTTVTPVIRGGDLVDGIIISSTGLDYDYDVSQNNAHWITFVYLSTGSSLNDYAIVVDGSIAMQEGDMINSAETWQYFDLVSINDTGNFVVSGDTYVPGGVDNSTKDEFVAYNGQIVLREGETVDGVPLNSYAYVYGLRINNQNHVYHHWYTNSKDYAFVTCDPSKFRERSRLILSNGDELDVDGNGVGDYTITDIRTSSSQQVGFGPGQHMYFEVSMSDASLTYEAIIEVDYGCCGNMMLEGPEECDDGNDVNNDGCTNSCKISKCGDGILDTTMGSMEQCDDGNSVDEDGCTNSCTLPTCGDGITSGSAGEECDDQNMIDDDACTNACKLPSCGDGILHPGEQCDDGNAIANDDCTNSCTTPKCGDGVVQMGEACDDGNTDNNDDCTNTCAPATCGDGTIQPPEECDDANSVDDDDCSNVCLNPFCGDGIVQSNEQCDDGNLDDTDDCTVLCRNAICGDGIRNAMEECDDGNLDNTDMCTNQCKVPGCGDGIVQAGEECDDGNGNDDDSCSSTCEGSMCGDGLVQPPEECDDGNTSNEDACTNACVLNDAIGGSGAMDTDGMDTDGDDSGMGGNKKGGCAVDADPERSAPWLLALVGLGLLVGRRRRRDAA